MLEVDHLGKIEEKALGFKMSLGCLGNSVIQMAFMAFSESVFDFRDVQREHQTPESEYGGGSKPNVPFWTNTCKHLQQTYKNHETKHTKPGGKQAL